MLVDATPEAGTWVAVAVSASEVMKNLIRPPAPDDVALALAPQISGPYPDSHWQDASWVSRSTTYWP